MGVNFNPEITEMESAILENLANSEPGYGRRKWAISKDTGIPLDVLTVLLKRLKQAGKIELINTFEEHNGKAAGSGYCLTEKHKK